MKKSTSQQFTITYEVTDESLWPDGTSGLLNAIESAEQRGDSSEVEVMVWQAARSGRLRALKVETVVGAA